jgi:hypothetical protein
MHGPLGARIGFGQERYDLGRRLAAKPAIAPSRFRVSRGLP